MISRPSKSKLSLEVTVLSLKLLDKQGLTGSGFSRETFSKFVLKLRCNFML